MSRSIVIFARTPEGEARAKGLRVAETAPLFDAVAAAWLEAAAQHDAVPVIACSTVDRNRLARIRPEIDRVWIEQRGASFGHRLATAVDDAFAMQYDTVIVTGIDAPPPVSEVLENAFASLEAGSFHAVIGPARDGGVNLIGLREPAPAVLRAISPRQRDVAQVCKSHFDSVLLLEAWTDVDAPHQLALARRERAWKRFAHLFVFAIPPGLEESGERVHDRSFDVRASRPPSRH